MAMTGGYQNIKLNRNSREGHFSEQKNKYVSVFKSLVQYIWCFGFKSFTCK